MKVQINRPDYYKGDEVVTLSASVTSGEVTKTKSFDFLVRKAARTKEQSLAEDVAYVKANVPQFIMSDITIMNKTTLPFGSTVVWEVTPATNLSVTGKVTRPDFGSPDEKVKITATVTNGLDTSEVVVIDSTILSFTQEDELDVVAKTITWDFIKGTNVDKFRVVDKLVLTNSISEVSISWASSDTRYIETSGKVNRPEYSESDVQVTLTATLSKGNKTKQIIINGIKVLKKSPSSTQRCFEYVQNAEEFLKWLTANGTNANISESSVVEDFILPAENDDMLLTWSVVNSSGEPYVNNYFKVEYKDDDLLPVSAEAARRYIATVTRNEANNTTAYLKVVANISETGEGLTLVPGGTASTIWQLVILKSGEPLMIQTDLQSEDAQEEYNEILRSTNIGRATWSIEKHKQSMRELYDLETEKVNIIVE